MTRGRRPIQGCGTVAAYKRGCRCDPCKAAKSAAWSAYTRTLRGDGKPGPTRRIHIDEIAQLLQWGSSIEDIARRLEVKIASIYRQAYRHGTGEERAVILRAMEGHGSGWSRAA